MYDGQECAEIRHTAARSLDAEKVEHGLKTMFGSVQYRIATICGIMASETSMLIHIHFYCSKYDAEKKKEKTLFPDDFDCLRDVLSLACFASRCDCFSRS